jgi:hypothetical protein
LDYVRIKENRYSINKSILHDFRLVKNFPTFEQEQERLTEVFLTSPEYAQMMDTTREMLLSASESDPSY